MELLQVQIALFPKAIIERPDLFKDGINSKIGNLFDTIPTVIGWPDDTPLEIPVVQAKSKDGKYALNIAKNRIDFIISYDFLEEEPLKTYKQNQIWIDKYCKSVANQCELVRMGVIYTLFEEDNLNVKRIFDKELKKEYSSDCIEAQIRINKRTTLKKLVINNIKTIEAGSITIHRDTEDIEKIGIICRLDINNVPSEVVLNGENINDVLSWAMDYIRQDQVKELV